MGKVAVLLGVCVGSLLGLVCASTAAAEVKLDWHAADGCPDAASVSATMHAWFESAGTPASAADVQIDADVKAADSGYALALKMQTPSGARQMQMFSATCDTFAQVIAVQASLLITSEKSEPAPRVDAERAVGAFALRVQGLLASNPLPAPAFGFGLTASYVFMPLRVELGLGYLLPRERRYDAHPDAGGSLQTGFATLRPCAVAELGGLELSGCAGAEAGMIRGKGLGVVGARATHRSWFAFVVGAGLHVPVTPIWSFVLGADLLVSLRRPDFYVEPLGLLYRPDLLGVRGHVGAEMRIP